MSIDLAIKYKAKLIEIEDNLKQLEEINIKIDKYDQPIKEIMDKISKEVEHAYQNLDKATSSTFLNDTLDSIYKKGIDELDLINRHITSEFETYYQIATKLASLKAKLSSITSGNISFYVNESKELLHKLVTSSTIDYDSEKEIVDELYIFTYKMIKLELIYNSDSILLDYVKKDDINSVYVANLIKEEITSLEKTEETNKIFLRFNELKANGFSISNIIDRELLILLISIKNKELMEDIRKNYLIQLDQYDSLSLGLEQLQTSTDNSLNEIKNAKKTLKASKFKRKKNRIIVYIDLAVVGLTMLFAVKISRALATTKQYKTITTVYDSSSDKESISEDYYPSIYDSVSLVEYSSWDRPGYFRDVYARNVYTYDLSNLSVSYENLSSYLNEDLKNQISLTSSKIEISEDIPDDIDYTGNKYVITSIKQDKKIYNKILNEDDYITCALLFGFVTIFADALLFLVVNPGFTLSKYEITSLDDKIKEAKEALKNNKQFLIDNKDKIEEFYNLLMQKKKKILENYDSLSYILQNDEEIKQKVLELKEDNIDKLK